MDKRFLLIPILVLLLISFSFAVAPTVSQPTVSPSVTGDLNYFTYPVTLTATGTGDTDADTNCFFMISNGGTRFTADYNLQTFICSLTLSSGSGTGDWNFAAVVESASLDVNGLSDSNAFYWRDSNAPTTTSSAVEYSTTNATVTISATDVATDTGDGSGVANTYYNIDSGSWILYSGPVTVSTIGSTTVGYYSVDNLDNNNVSVGGSTIVTLTGGGAVTCTLINLFPLLLVALAFISGGGLMAYRKATQGEIKGMVTFVITIIIGVVIVISVLPIMC